MTKQSAKRDSTEGSCLVAVRRLWRVLTHDSGSRNVNDASVEDFWSCQTRFWRVVDANGSTCTAGRVT